MRVFKYSTVVPPYLFFEAGNVTRYSHVIKTWPVIYVIVQTTWIYQNSGIFIYSELEIFKWRGVFSSVQFSFILLGICFSLIIHLQTEHFKKKSRPLKRIYLRHGFSRENTRGGSGLFSRGILIYKRFDIMRIPVTAVYIMVYIHTSSDGTVHVKVYYGVHTYEIHVTFLSKQFPTYFTSKRFFSSVKARVVIKVTLTQERSITKIADVYFPAFRRLHGVTSYVLVEIKWMDLPVRLPWLRWITRQY